MLKCLGCFIVCLLCSSTNAGEVSATITTSPAAVYRCEGGVCRLQAIRRPVQRSIARVRTGRLFVLRPWLRTRAVSRAVVR